MSKKGINVKKFRGDKIHFLAKHGEEKGSENKARPLGDASGIYIYTYIYMLLGSFAAPQNGFLGFICGLPRVHLRPPLFETTVFIARNGFFAVSGNQISSLFSVFRVFQKCHFGGRRGRFLRSEQIFVFCVCFWSGLFQAQSKR